MAETVAPIQHIVVVMLENRSYDNVLGWLYGANNSTAPAGQKDLQGLSGTESNPNPYTGQPQTVQEAAPSQIGGTGQTYAAEALPLIDPNETFGNMAQQYLAVDPSTHKPYEGYATSDGVMTGYLDNYQTAPDMTASNVGDVLTYLTPQQLPVTSFLAQHFGVCDEWYASVPSQTFVNRLFAVCAAPQILDDGDSSKSVVDDADHKFDVLNLLPSSEVVETASLFSVLDACGIPWKLYFHDYSIAILTMPYLTQSGVQNNLSTFDLSDWGAGNKPLQLNAAPASTFVDDIQNKSLPRFAFIEPRYNLDSPFVTNDLPPNSNHPGAAKYGVHIFTKEPEQVEPKHPPIDTNGGELLLMQVYNLLRNSGYWDSTLLIVTYDEAGGLYDHLPPPLLPAPGNAYTGNPPTVSTAIPEADSKDDEAAKHFDYTVGGGRVPAIVISPRIKASSTVRDSDGKAFDHTSIIRTAYDIFGLAAFDEAPPSLTSRDAAAPSLEPFVTSLNVINDAPAFSGTIVPSPAMVILEGDRTIHVVSATLLASAGPGIALTATPSSITTYENNGKNWVTVSPSTIATAPNVTAWTIGYDLHAVEGLHKATLEGQVAISAGGAPTVNVQVWLYLS
jgi:phospholipase C